MKIWRSNEKGDDKIIAYFNDTIYQCNPKPADIDDAAYNLKLQIIPKENCTGIPLSYLKEIHLQDGKNYIEIFFGKESEEQLKINNPEKRNEIFEYFKANIPKTKYIIDKYSKIRAGKKPFIAMCFVVAIGAWALYIANGMESGSDYRVVGQQRSLANIVLVIASLGTKKVLLIFGFLFAVALASFIYKTRIPKVVQKIIVQR